jgi:hypothetical protein
MISAYLNTQEWCRTTPTGQSSFRSVAISLGLVCVIWSIFSLTGFTMASATTDNRHEDLTSEHLEALRTANTFLWAWLSRDADLGSKLISEHLRSQTSNDSWLRDFMVGLSNPHHQAFKIHSSSMRGANRYVFSVILYELYSGERNGWAYESNMEVVREKGAWLVDHLPKSSDNP